MFSWPQLSHFMGQRESHPMRPRWQTTGPRLVDLPPVPFEPPAVCTGGGGARSHAGPEGSSRLFHVRSRFRVLTQVCPRPGQPLPRSRLAVDQKELSPVAQIRKEHRRLRRQPLFEHLRFFVRRREQRKVEAHSFDELLAVHRFEREATKPPRRGGLLFELNGYSLDEARLSRFELQRHPNERSRPRRGRIRSLNRTLDRLRGLLFRRRFV